MITATMTGQEIINLYQEKDFPIVDSVIEKKSFKLSKELRKGLGKRAAQCYDVHTDNADYKVSIGVGRNLDKCIADVYAYCRETNDYVIVTSTVSLGFKCDAFAITPHYIKRYAERCLHRSEYGVNQVLASMTLDHNFAIKIYESGKYSVLALKGGLSLDVFDEKRRVEVAKTYVSLDMLKSSQVSAYKKVEKLLGKYNSVFANPVKDPILEGKKFAEEVNEAALSIEEISEIYGKFFNEKKK